MNDDINPEVNQDDLPGGLKKLTDDEITGEKVTRGSKILLQEEILASYIKNIVLNEKYYLHPERNTENEEYLSPEMKSKNIKLIRELQPKDFERNGKYVNLAKKVKNVLLGEKLEFLFLDAMEYCYQNGFPKELDANFFSCILGFGEKNYSDVSFVYKESLEANIEFINKMAESLKKQRYPQEIVEKTVNKVIKELFERYIAARIQATSDVYFDFSTEDNLAKAIFQQKIIWLKRLADFWLIKKICLIA